MRSVTGLQKVQRLHTLSSLFHYSEWNVCVCTGAVSYSTLSSCSGPYMTLGEWALITFHRVEHKVSGQRRKKLGPRVFNALVKITQRITWLLD